MPPLWTEDSDEGVSDVSEEIKVGDIVYVGHIEFADLKELDGLSSFKELENSLCILKYLVVSIEKSPTGGDSILFCVLIYYAMDQDVFVDDLKDGEVNLSWEYFAREGRLVTPLSAIRSSEASKSAEVAIAMEIQRLRMRAGYCSRRADLAADLVNKLRPRN